MQAAANFDELKRELEQLGFKDPSVANELRSALARDLDWFSIDTLVLTEKEQVQMLLHFATDANGRRSLEYYTGVINPGQGSDWKHTDELRDQAFRPEVPVQEAVSVLQYRLRRDEVSDPVANTPMSRQEVRASLGLSLNPDEQLHLLKSTEMNTENLEFLQKNLLNLGFGDKVNHEMEKLIAAKVPEFKLTTEQEYHGKKMDYTLHFKAGDQHDMYFFNRYDASLKNEADPAKDRIQTMYIHKGHGVTAKEAFNLMEGRSVEKKLYNKENEPYQAWLKLDFKNKDEQGNHKLMKFSQGYGYDLEKTLAQYPIKQLNDTQQKEELLRSLKKGNAQQVTVEKDGQHQKLYVVAVPQYKTLNFYDQNMQSVKREQVLKQENSPRQNQSRDKKQSQQNETDDSPKKQQGRKQKVH